MFLASFIGSTGITVDAKTAATYEPSSVSPPKPMREFRAAWVATVANIDWPSRKGLATAEQKAELSAIFERAAQLKLNAVIIQVRPACDALYPSEIEPWSEYLTGVMGKPPDPFYDPLNFAIEAAHQRGLELHAWFNPYRAGHPSAKSTIAPNHISKTRPHLVRQYGKYLWLDPGEREVQDYSLSVVMDVLKRYDIDGVHFDDYFYPYKEKDRSGNELDFPDDPSWQRFGAGRKLSRDDWRRENVNGFIQRVYASIKATKPWVKFGISPFGIWRPENPPQIRGYDAYSKLYADSRKWLAKGWIDYFAPQLYWGIQPPDQSFPVLLKWWAQQNARGRHLFPGLDATKTVTQSGEAIYSDNRWNAEEIVNQIRLTRKQTGADGHVHWNMKSLMRNHGLAEALEKEVYAQPALVPAYPWLGRERLGKPSIAVSGAEGASRLQLNWGLSGPAQPWLWVLQTRNSGEWKTDIFPARKSSQLWKGAAPEIVAISAVDRNGNISPSAALQLKR